MTKKRIHKIYGIFLSVALILAGVCLMVACVRIYQGTYRTDGGLFSPEAVAAAFAPIAIPVYIALALLVGSLILHIFLPEEAKKTPPEKQYEIILERFAQKLNKNACNPGLCREITRQQALRKNLQIVCISLLAVCSVIFLVYALNIRNFPFEDATGSVVRSMWLFLPCLAVPFGFAVFAAYAKKASLIKEIDLVKEALAQGAQASAPASPAPAKNRETQVKITKFAILGIALALFVFGFCFGGTADVLKKAINLCTECVGLG